MAKPNKKQKKKVSPVVTVALVAVLVVVLFIFYNKTFGSGTPSKARIEALRKKAAPTMTALQEKYPFDANKKMFVCSECGQEFRAWMGAVKHGKEAHSGSPKTPK